MRSLEGLGTQRSDLTALYYSAHAHTIDTRIGIRLFPRGESKTSCIAFLRAFPV